MGIATSTIVMRTPELVRERLHDLVKEARRVVVLSGDPDDPLDGRPMVLARTDDDTTMYLATSLRATPGEGQRRRRVTALLQGEGYARFSAELRIARDRGLIRELWSDVWRVWSHGKLERSLAIVILSPIEGAYWEGTDRHSYVYRLVQDQGSAVV